MARIYGTTWAHLHIGRARRGLLDVISVKNGAQPTHYRETLYLKDVVFCVREAGRLRTLAEGVKNVHAWVTGERVVTPWTPDVVPQHMREIKYTPQAGYFYDARTGAPITRAKAVWMSGSKVYAYDSR